SAPFRALPREPRRAPRRRGLPARRPPGRGDDHVPRPRPAFLPRRPAHWPQGPPLRPPGPTSRRADRRDPARLLRPPARRPQASRAARRPLATPRLPPRLGREPFARPLPRLLLGGRGREAPDRRRQLQPELGPVLCFCSIR